MSGQRKPAPDVVGCIMRALESHQAATLADLKRIQGQGGAAAKQVSELALIEVVRRGPWVRAS